MEVLRNKLVKKCEKRMKKPTILTLVLMLMINTACGEEEERLRDLEFTVVSEECILPELAAELEKKKTEAFGESFSDGAYLYMCAGYGEMETGGYSIAIKEVYLTQQAIYIDTTLMGPSSEDKKKYNEPSYPMIVVKTEFIDAPVIFL